LSRTNCKTCPREVNIYNNNNEVGNKYQIRAPRKRFWRG